jgi:hypothetical protein
VQIKFGCGLDSRIYRNAFFNHQPSSANLITPYSVDLIDTSPCHQCDILQSTGNSNSYFLVIMFEWSLCWQRITNMAFEKRESGQELGITDKASCKNGSGLFDCLRDPQNCTILTHWNILNSDDLIWTFLYLLPLIWTSYALMRVSSHFSACS